MGLIELDIRNVKSDFNSIGIGNANKFFSNVVWQSLESTNEDTLEKI